MIKWIAFDADDTLWENERYYTESQKKLGEILSPYLDGADIGRILYETEKENIPYFGYGIKSFGLSMIETAIRHSNHQITSHEICRILDLLKDMIDTPPEVLPGVKGVLESLKDTYQMMIITKGDLLDQERKLSRSNLTHYFERMEVVSEKNEITYQNLLHHHQISPQNFMMIGNSLKSDVLPVVAIGGIGVHIVEANTWEHEKVENAHEHAHRYYSIDHIHQLPELIQSLRKTA